MKKITLEKSEANQIVWENHPDWEMVPGTREGGEVYKRMQGFEAVFEHKPTGKFYSTCWGVMHDDWGQDPFEYDEPEFCEMERHEETIVTVTWKGVEDD